MKACTLASHCQNRNGDFYSVRPNFVPMFSSFVYIEGEIWSGEIEISVTIFVTNFVTNFDPLHPTNFVPGLLFICIYWGGKSGRMRLIELELSVTNSLRFFSFVTILQFCYEFVAVSGLLLHDCIRDRRAWRCSTQTACMLVAQHRLFRIDCFCVGCSASVFMNGACVAWYDESAEMISPLKQQ